jgi:hypothetical protein
VPPHRLVVVFALGACTGTNIHYAEPDAGGGTPAVDASRPPPDAGAAGATDTGPGADMVPPPPDAAVTVSPDARRPSPDTGIARPPDAGAPPDLDRDGHGDLTDNCPEAPNADQADRDADGRGDACDRCPDGGDDLDADGDGASACGDDCNDADPAVHPGAIERCDGLDNDCQGGADDPFLDLGAACATGQGLCRAEGVSVCTADGTGTRCDAAAFAPVDEVCDTYDNDCDGNADEALAGCCRPGDTLPCGQDVGRCRAGVQTCDAQRQYGACDGTGPAEEVCNGVDDDCDGATDEDGDCGGYVREHCRVWLAWGMNGQGADAADAWGPCPGVGRHREGDLQCTATPWRADAPEAAFSDVDVRANVDADDRLGVRFECADAQNEALSTYVESHCAVYFGWADFNLGPADAPTWGPWPAQAAGEADGRRCVSSAYDARFHSMALGGQVDDNDDFAVAFLCRDDAEPARAARLQASVEVYLGLDDDASPVREASRDWGDCPGAAVDLGGSARCASSGGDGLFHRFDATDGVYDGATFGVGLTVRRAR